MFEDLGCRVTLVSVVDEHLEDDILRFCGHVGYQLGNALELLRGKVKFHVSSILLNFSMISADGVPKML